MLFVCALVAVQGLRLGGLKLTDLKLGQRVAAAVAVPLLLFGGEVQAKSPAQWDAKVQVEQLKAPVKDAIGPKVGDMVAIRFVGSYQGKVFDDTMSADLPYFYRAGAGLIVKGLDDAVVHMKLGEKLALSFGGDLAFEKGRPSSAGKARIPPGATIDYEVELVDLPGTADEDSMILDEL